MFVTVGNVEVACPLEGGNVAVPGYKGLLSCPASNVICQMLQSQCSGNGILQTDGSCICYTGMKVVPDNVFIFFTLAHIGFSGAECSLIDCPRKNGAECSNNGECNHNTGTCIVCINNNALSSSSSSSCL